MEAQQSIKDSTLLQRCAEKKPIRIFASAFVVVFKLVNVILAGTAIHVSPPGLSGILGYEILLSILTAAFTGVALWQPLAGQRKSTARVFLALSTLTTLLWATALLALIILLATVPDSLSYVAPGSGPGVSPPTYFPAIGCVVLNSFFFLAFLFNTVYCRTLMDKLWPKYAEVDEEGQGIIVNSRSDQLHNDDGADEAWRPDLQMEEDEHHTSDDIPEQAWKPGGQMAAGEHYWNYDTQRASGMV